MPKQEEVRLLIDMIYSLERRIRTLLKEENLPETAREGLERSIRQGDNILAKLRAFLSILKE